MSQIQSGPGLSKVFPARVVTPQFFAVRIRLGREVANRSRPSASKATSAPPSVSSSTRATASPGRGVDQVGRAQRAGGLELLLVDVDGDDLQRAVRLGELDDQRPHPARADDRDALAETRSAPWRTAPNAVSARIRGPTPPRTGSQPAAGTRRRGQHGVLGETAHRVHRERGAVGAEQPRLAVVERPAQPVEREEGLAEVVARGRDRPGSARTA